MMNAIGRERGWPPMTRADYEAAAEPRGANFVGSPQQVVEKILYQHELFGHERFLVQFSVGTMPHDQMLHVDRAAWHRGRASRAGGVRASRGRMSRPPGRGCERTAAEAPSPGRTRVHQADARDGPDPSGVR